MLGVQDAGDIPTLPFPFSGFGGNAVYVELVGNTLEATASGALPRDSQNDSLFRGIVGQACRRAPGFPAWDIHAGPSLCIHKVTVER